MPFEFFFSYARENRSRHLERFRKNLIQQLKLRKHFPKDEIGFFDGEDIKAGDNWKDALGTALRTSRVFLALCSPDYINSEYCGKEFQIFLERFETYKKTASSTRPPRLIMPILWGDPRGSLRDVISQFQYTDDQYPAIYAEEGLSRMMDQKKHADAYKQFVIRLANKIVENSAAHPMPDLATLRPLENVNSAFHTAEASESEEGDRAWFIFVAGKPADFQPPRTAVDRYKTRGGKDWRPFSPASSASVGIVAQSVASLCERYFSEMPVDAKLIDRIKTATQEPVFVIADAWSLELPIFRDVMRELDRNITDTCALVIPWNAPDDETEQHRQDLKEQLRNTFKYRASVGKLLHYWGEVESADDLKARLLDMMAHYTNRVTELHRTPESKKIANEEVQASIEEKGVGVERPPGVKSPSGGAVG
jgi:FxsC-like protein